MSRTVVIGWLYYFTKITDTVVAEWEMDEHPLHHPSPSVVGELNRYTPAAVSIVSRHFSRELSCPQVLWLCLSGEVSLGP